MSPMALAAFLLSVLVAVVGAVGLIRPTSLLAVAGLFLTPAGLYAAAAFRIVLGTGLFVGASTSRAPRLLRVLGVVIVVGGLVTPLLGVERASAIIGWWAARGSLFMRIWAAVALAFGLCLAYALVPRNSRADSL
jgi:hypothetical protein